MKLLIAAFFLVVMASGLSEVAGDDKIVCYFSSWAVWRPSYGKFDVEDIDPFLCTHIMFSFTGLSNVTWEIEVLDPWNELCPDEPGGHNCAFERAVALKQLNPSLVIMIAIGGWNEGSEDYSVTNFMTYHCLTGRSHMRLKGFAGWRDYKDVYSLQHAVENWPTMAADPWKRTTFINSVLSFIDKYKFDGLDFDWEYPAARGGIPEDKENFVNLMKEMRTAFDAATPRLLISGAFAAGKEVIDEGYYMTSLVDLFDLFHIMAYDYHGAWENFTHHNSPLCGHYLDHDEFLNFNVKFTIDYYLELGIPKEKLVLGTPTYGRCYTLANYNEHGVWDKTTGSGAAGPYIRIPGTLGFNEICERLRDDKSCTIVHDPALHEPYFYCMSDYIWCSYDDPESMHLKARYAKNMGLAGVMVWQIDTDDFYPECYTEPFPLINSLKRAFAEPAGGDIITCDPITPVPPSTTTPISTTTPTTTTPTTTTPTTTTPATTTPTTTTPMTTTPTTTTPMTTSPTTTTPTTTTPTTTTPMTTSPTITAPMTTTPTTTTPTTSTPTTTTPTTTIPTTTIPTTTTPTTTTPMTTTPTTTTPMTTTPTTTTTTTSTPTTTTPTTTTPTTTAPMTTTTPTTTTPTTTTPMTTTPTTTTPMTTTPTTTTPTTTTTTPTATTQMTTTPTTTTSTPTTTIPTTTTTPATTPTTTTPTTTIPTTTTTPTTTPTPATPTTTTILTTTPSSRPKPDCSEQPDGSTFPHADCNKYWKCASKSTILELCAPGTLYDEFLFICNWEDQVDTSQCRMWHCNIDNTYYPAVYCNQYYWCYNGAPHLQTCPDGEYWHQSINQCDHPSSVDTSQCQIP